MVQPYPHHTPRNRGLPHRDQWPSPSTADCADFDGGRDPTVDRVWAPVGAGPGSSARHPVASIQSFVATYVPPHHRSAGPAALSSHGGMEAVPLLWSVPGSDGSSRPTMRAYRSGPSLE